MRSLLIFFTLTFCYPTFAAPRADPCIVSVSAGIGSVLQHGQYTTVRVVAQYEGTEPLHGRLVIACRRQKDDTTLDTVEREVDLPPRSRKMFELPLLVPDEKMDTLDVALWTERQRVARTVVELPVMDSSVDTLCVVGDDPLQLQLETQKNRLTLFLGNSPMRYSSVPRSLRVVSVPDWAALPATAMGYESVDTLVVVGAPSSSFSPDQRMALKRWLRDGGTLFVCAGGSLAAMQQSFLSEWLPVTMTGTMVLNRLRPLALIVDNPPIPPEKMSVAVSRPRRGTQIIAGDAHLPWVVKGKVGYHGTIVFVAFDPQREPFRSWQGRTDFWRTLLRWCEGNGGGPSLTGFHPSELNTLIREAKVVDVPSRYIFLAPIVAHAFIMLVASLIVTRFARRKEMTWLVLSLISALFGVGYFAALRRTIKGQLYLAGVTTRVVLPNDPVEYQNAGATLFLPTQHPVEYAVYAPNVRLSAEEAGESRTWRLEEDATRLRINNPRTWWVTQFRAYAETPRKGVVASRVRQDETTFHYDLTNRTPYTLRHGRILVLTPDKWLVRGVPTLLPNASAQVTVSPVNGERWERYERFMGRMPRAKMDNQQRVRRWLAQKVLEADESNLLTDESHDGAFFVAFTDRPPFPMTAPGLRQDWYHLFVTPLPGVHPERKRQLVSPEEASSNLGSAQLLSATARIEDDSETGTTNLYRGAALMEFPVEAFHSKQKLVVTISVGAKPQRGARLECAIYNWRTGQWTKWTPSTDKKYRTYSGADESAIMAYETFSLDHVHPSLFTAHVKFIVRGASSRSFVAFNQVEVSVKTPTEEEQSP
jgi:hypothetical protein